MDVQEAVQATAVVGVTANAKVHAAVVVKRDVVIFLIIQAIRTILINNIFLVHNATLTNGLAYK